MQSAEVAGAEGQPQLVPDPPFDSLTGLARHIAVSGMAGLFTGVVVGGVGGRIFMRIAGAVADHAQGRTTEAGFIVGDVTLGGILALVVFIGLFTGIVGATLFVAFTPWIAWAGRWRGPVFGLLLFGIASATSDVMNPDNIDFVILQNSALLVGLIVVLFLAFGIVLVLASDFLDPRMPATPEEWEPIRGLYIAIAILGAIAATLVVPALFTEVTCDCVPPHYASWSVVVAGVGTLLWWASALVAGWPDWLSRVASALGFGGLAGTFIFGLLRAVSDAIEIIT